MSCYVVVDRFFDCGDNASTLIPLSESVIYETHVKGTSMRHPEVPQGSPAPPQVSAVAQSKASAKALHAADLEVILDVITTTPAEGKSTRTTTSWRAIDNPAYYCTWSRTTGAAPLMSSPRPP